MIFVRCTYRVNNTDCHLGAPTKDCCTRYYLRPLLQDSIAKVLHPNGSL